MHLTPKRTVTRTTWVIVAPYLAAAKTEISGLESTSILEDDKKHRITINSIDLRVELYRMHISSNTLLYHRQGLPR